MITITRPVLRKSRNEFKNAFGFSVGHKFGEVLVSKQK
jgi:hypothetical protein